MNLSHPCPVVALDFVKRTAQRETQNAVGIHVAAPGLAPGEKMTQRKLASANLSSELIKGGAGVFLIDRHPPGAASDAWFGLGAIQTVGFDEGLDAARNHVTDGPRFGDPAADVVRGDPEGGHIHKLSRVAVRTEVRKRSRVDLRDSGTIHHHDGGQPRDPGRGLAMWAGRPGCHRRSGRRVDHRDAHGGPVPASRCCNAVRAVWFPGRRLQSWDDRRQRSGPSPDARRQASVLPACAEVNRRRQTRRRRVAARSRHCSARIR